MQDAPRRSSGVAVGGVRKRKGAAARRRAHAMQRDDDEYVAIQPARGDMDTREAHQQTEDIAASAAGDLGVKQSMKRGDRTKMQKVRKITKLSKV
jgi:hypothetical protein